MAMKTRGEGSVPLEALSAGDAFVRRLSGGRQEVCMDAGKRYERRLESEREKPTRGTGAIHSGWVDEMTGNSRAGGEDAAVGRDRLMMPPAASRETCVRLEDRSGLDVARGDEALSASTWSA